MSSRSIGSLTLDLVARIGGFESGLDKAARISEKRMKEIQATAKKVGAGIGLAFGAAATGFVAFVKTQTDAIAAYQDVAEKIGDTAEAVASLKAAVDVSGTSIDAITAASVKLTAALFKTNDEGQGVGQALKAIGLELETFKKLSPVEQIDAVARALNRFGDGANKTAVAVALFGESGAQLLPFLSDLADGAERQTILTQAQIEAANELQETWAALRGQAGTLSQTLAADIIPVVLEVVKAFDSLIQEVKEIGGDDSIKKFAQSAALGLVSVIEFTNRTIQTLNALRGSFQVVFNDIRVFSKAAGLLNPLSSLLGGGLSNQLGSLGALLDKREETQREANARYAELFNTNFTQVSDSLSKTFDEQQNYVEKVAVLAKPELKFSGIPPETVKKAKAALDEYAVSLESARAIQEEVERLQQEQNKLLQEAAGVYAATRTPLEKFNAEIERLNRLRDTFVDGKPLLDETTYRRAVVAVQDDLHSLSAAAKDVADEMTVFWEEAARNMQGILSNFLVDPFKDGLKGLVANFADALQQMAAEAAAAQIFKGLAAGVSGSGGFFDFILGLGGGLGGSTPIGGARAMGGPVSPGKAYLVGEQGPEWMVPSGAGTIIPNGGGMTVNQSFVINAPSGSVSKATQLQIAAQASKGAARGSIRNN